MSATSDWSDTLTARMRQVQQRQSRVIDRLEARPQELTYADATDTCLYQAEVLLTLTVDKTTRAELRTEAEGMKKAAPKTTDLAVAIEWLEKAVRLFDRSVLYGAGSDEHSMVREAYILIRDARRIGAAR
jgi:hypothetical protein